MKILLFLVLNILVLRASSEAKAQTKTPASGPTATVSQISPTPKDTDLIEKLKQIEIFKEKIATKVAQVRNEDKGAIYGQIKSIENNNIVVTSLKNDRKINFSEDTLIFKLDNNIKKEAKSADFKKDIFISAFGNYNDNREILLAKFIYIEEYLTRIAGKITDLDKANFTLTVKANSAVYLIDIEKYTKTIIFEKGKGIVKGGFSKFKVGDSVFTVVTPNTKEENRFFADRIILLSVLPLTPTLTPSLSPSPPLPTN